MEIYYDGNVYGIRWKIYDSNNQLVQQFEKIYSKKMTKQDIEEVKQEYNKLTEFQLSNANFSVYTTYGEGTYMGWVKYDKDVIYNFINFFNNY